MNWSMAAEARHGWLEMADWRSSYDHAQAHHLDEGQPWQAAGLHRSVALDRALGDRRVGLALLTRRVRCM